MPSVVDRFSSQDASFLEFEGRDTPMHVGAVVIFERDKLKNAEGGVDINRIRKFIDAKLDALPRYRQRLAETPISGSAVWVDDQHFDIDYHVRHTAVPIPGRDADLKVLVGRLLEQRLDRSRPLWEMWVVDALSEDRFALVMKIHHCMIDGASGMHLMPLLFEVEEYSEVPAGSSWSPSPEPSGLDLLVDEVSQRAENLRDRVRQVADELKHPAHAVQVAGEAVSDMVSALEGVLQAPAQTPINQPIGPHRRVEWRSVPLQGWKHVRKATGATINDIALAVLTAGLRRFLAERDFDLGSDHFRVCLPVDVRPPDDDFSASNRVSALFADLPIGEPDPLRQLEAIRTQTKQLKASGAAHGTELLVGAADLIGANWLTRAGVMLANVARPHNLIVTNVRGPDMPVYLLGARMLGMMPFLPLFDHQGLGVAVTSLCGEVTFGLVGDRDLLPDLALLANHLEEASASLLEVVGAGESLLED
jgi:diacylglycerol O-acyltransferase